MLIANKHQNPFPVIQMKVNNVSSECKQLLQWMLQPNPSQRPSAEQCIQHKWFSKDREALQGSLFINKNQQLLANLFNQQQLIDQGNEFNSFKFAPNYYEFVQCISSKLSLNSLNRRASLNNKSGIGSQENSQYSPQYENSPVE